jgi:hypothetical protein
MLVKTAWPALVPAIEKAGHKAVIVTEAEVLAQHGKKIEEPPPEQERKSA